jgi:fructan beta-fructosidase
MNCWVMVVSLAAKKVIQFYRSTDLKAWTLLSEFGPAGAANKPNWECPDLFELPIENEPGATRWVLHAGMGNGAVAGGSGGEYFTGTFDGTRFVADSRESQWADYGRDFYAAVSWSNIPQSDGRRIWIGWMNNWETCLNPTVPWRGAMSIPRELTLRRVHGKLRLCQQPVRELKQLRTGTLELQNLTLNDESRTLDKRGRQLEIELDFEPGTASEVGVRVLKGKDEQTVIGYDARSKKLSVDRTKSGNVSFHPAVPGRHTAPLEPDKAGRIRLQILLDSCSVEVFGNDGEVAITDLVFPNASSDEVELFSKGGSCTLSSLKVSSLRCVWKRAPEQMP